MVLTLFCSKSPSQPIQPAQAEILRPNIGAKNQNQAKSSQIQPSLPIKIGSPIVHLAKIHRRSESLFGVRLFSFAIWFCMSMVSSELTNMFPT